MDVGIAVPIGNIKIAVRSLCDISRMVERLIELGLIGAPRAGRPADDRGLINVTGMMRLHNGAIWQLHSKLNDQEEELTALRGQLTALQEGK